jgi:hypothetical protein
MSAVVDRLLKQLESRGLSIAAGAEPGQLLLRGPSAEKTPDVIEAVKAFKPLLLARVAPPPPPDRPTTRPAATPPPDPAYELVREGACQARRDAKLCWAAFQAGGWYWFEELTAAGRTSYRVFAGVDFAHVIPAMFEELFTTDRSDPDGDRDR